MWSAATVVVCALNLLGRSAHTLPPIEFVHVAPPGTSAHVEAFVDPATRAIVLVTSSAVFQDAQRATFRCGGHAALRKIASIVVHEEWHIRHGSDERGAYHAQLTTLAAMGSGPNTPVYSSVVRAMLAVEEREKQRAAALVAQR